MRAVFFVLSLCLSQVLFSQRNEILEVLTKQQNAWNKGDIDAYMQGYFKSDSLVFIGGKGPTYGWQKTLDNYKKSYPNKATMGELLFSDIDVKPLGKDYAFVIGKWRLTREKDSPHGNFTLVFQKLKEGWRIISDHTD